MHFVIKLGMEIPIFSTLSLNSLQPGEELQPDAMEQDAVLPNEDLVAQLHAMGFPEERCKRAALSSGNTGKAFYCHCISTIFCAQIAKLSDLELWLADVEAAMEWLLAHDDDGGAEVLASGWNQR